MGNGSWSNDASNLIILIEQITGYSGLFGYSPAPGPGNLVLSITANAGTDPYGNAYAAGITLYSSEGTINLDGTSATWNDTINGSGIQISVAGGAVLEEFEPSTVAGVTWDHGAVGATLASRLGTNTPETFLVSPTNDTNPGSTSSLALYGYPQTSNGDVTSEAITTAQRVFENTPIGWITGSWIKAAETWHTPTFSGSWVSTGTLNTNATFQGLQYRKDAEDNVWLSGGATTTAAGGSIFTLPAGFFHTTRRHLVPCWIFDSSAGTTSASFVQVTEAGVVNVAASLTNITIATGDQVYINGKFPLGNIT
jgi:hypothetical protein